MYRDPILETPAHRREFDARLKPLWLLALDRPEVELRRQAAWAFAQASLESAPGLEDVPARLIEILQNQDEDPSVVMAGAMALVQFNHRPAAEILLQRSMQQAGLDLIVMVDPVLARWDYLPARQVWLDRLANHAAAPRKAVLAMRALATVRATQAVDKLRDIAVERKLSQAVRLEAGRALGVIANSGLLGTATSLAGGDQTDRLIGASILASHTDAKSISLLKQLALDRDPTVAGTALAVLGKIDPLLVVALSSDIADHDDPNIRLEYARALASDHSDTAVIALGRLLGDKSVAVRTTARQNLIEFYSMEALQPVVRRVVTIALGGQSWRGFEQGALLCGILDLEAEAERLLELLAAPRPEVRLAAANALRLIQVPQTLPRLLEHAEQLTGAAKTTPPDDRVTYRAIGQETTQLFMAFGEMRYQSADSLLRQYIPKGSGFAARTRGAAVWALGKIHQGEVDAELANSFVSRLSDISPMNPESQVVRRFAAIGLGRMKAVAALPTLQRFLKEGMYAADISGSCRWAIVRITGKQLPPLESGVTTSSGWFLEPLR